MLAVLGEAAAYLLAGLFYFFPDIILKAASVSWYLVIPFVCILVGAGTWLCLDGSWALGLGLWLIGVFIGLMRLLVDHTDDDGALY